MTKLSDLTTDQIRRYFSSRLKEPNWKSENPQQITRCPWHEDRTPSLSVNLEAGTWKCHAGCGSGGLIDFEQRTSGKDRHACAEDVIEAATGQHEARVSQRRISAVYKYRDEGGGVLFEKVRYEPKDFVVRRPNGQGGHDYGIGACRRVLYNLPQVITANHVIICEGEKDSDRILGLNLAQYDRSGLTRLAVTTNFDGAGKWRPEYSPYFCGKSVTFLPDNDDPGRAHAKLAADSVLPYAHAVKIVNLPEIPPKGDVSDYLERHSAEDLVREMRNAKPYQKPLSPLLIPDYVFGSVLVQEISWLVEGAIELGSNGFICSEPKVGKSWLACDLALSVALGVPWLGLNIREPRRVALISREDNPSLTRWRRNRLLMGKGFRSEDTGDRFWINSKDQSPQFKLDNPEQFAEMLGALRQVRPDLIILDVLNRLHSADENDNTQMSAVLERADLFHRELGASVCIVHHFGKSEGSLTKRLRGASAIMGWAEWIIGVTKRPELGILAPRDVEFELKAPSPVDRLSFMINNYDHEGQLTDAGHAHSVRIEISSETAEPRDRRRLN